MHPSWIDITPISIDAEAREYLCSFVDSLTEAISKSPEIDEVDIEAIRRRIVREQRALPAHARLQLEAANAVLADLVKQGWLLRREGKSIFGERPKEDPAVVRAQRRRQFSSRRNDQLREAATREFIAGMERGHIYQGRRVSVFSLMRDGRELAVNLESTASDPSGCIKPYLQVVERGQLCDQTGLELTDIWRYFRHTWSNPYESVPGRTMQVLVRDAAAPYHPVMGIAALSSAASVLPPRDTGLIGWTADVLLAEMADWPVDKRRQWAAWLTRFLDNALDRIYRVDLIEEGVLPSRLPQTVSDDVIARLVEEGKTAKRSHGAETRDHAYVPPKGNGSMDDAYWENQARTSLFRAKRATELANLLAVRNVVFQAYKGKRGAARLESLVSTAEGRNAFSKIIRKARSDSIGSAIADLTVCGAVAPYNELAAGKLVALLCISPEMVDAYRKRYSESASVIGSSMAGRRLVKAANLVFVGTTSLYGLRPNQYDRASIPSDVLGSTESHGLVYRYLGNTEGYGTSQFGETAKVALERLVEMRNNGRTVNNIFGEGANPRLRALREGIFALGMPEDLLRHDLRKCVYGVSLVKPGTLRDYLLGLSKRVDYVASSARLRRSSDEISRWWLRRWALRRGSRPDILARVRAQTLIHPISHGARVQLPDADIDQLRLFPNAP